MNGFILVDTDPLNYAQIDSGNLLSLDALVFEPLQASRTTLVPCVIVYKLYKGERNHSSTVDSSVGCFDDGGAVRCLTLPSKISHLVQLC